MRIEVSDDTFAKLQKLAVPFEDKTPEDVIKRLMAAGDQRAKGSRGRRNEVGNGSLVGSALFAHGGSIPHGTELRAVYKGKEYLAVVKDGSLVWDGRSFSSPSKAAVAVIQRTGSDRTGEDGWRFWKYEAPDGNWKPLDDLRGTDSPLGKAIGSRS